MPPGEGGRGGFGGRGARRDAQPRIEKPLTAAALERSALWHLQRRAMTEHELRTALGRKIKRAAAVHGVCADADAWTDALVLRLQDSLLIDDTRVARARVDSARARGQSKRKIAMSLRHKGVASDVVAAAIDAVDVDNNDRAANAEDDDGCNPVGPELRAALVYVQRRRLRDKEPQKALAALARQGFAYDVCRRALAPVDD